MINQTSDQNKIGIIHFSDIHFSKDVNFYQDKYTQVFTALRDDFIDCCCIYLVVSGDIANTGNAAEYELALDYFTKLAESIRSRYPLVELQYILVPGNHDCDFSLDNQLRKNTIERVNYEILGNDNSIVSTCINVQNSFWEFYELFNDSSFPNRMYYRIVKDHGKNSICFHCFNTSWMSKKDETLGSLFFPVKKFLNHSDKMVYDINIAVYHHPINWFNANAPINNKREFQQSVESISSLQLTGHEHQNELRSGENLDSIASKTFYAANDVFQDIRDCSNSGFQTFVVDLGDANFSLRRYRWKNDFYERYSEKSEFLIRKSCDAIIIKDSFLKNLNRISIPISFEKSEVLLSDIYTYPDLEVLSPTGNDSIDSYIDSDTLIETSQNTTCILEGESQVGKSGLIQMLFMKYLDNGYYPILISGKEIVNDNYEHIISKAFKNQYIMHSSTYAKFQQLPSKKKVLLIDDIHLSKVAKEKIKCMIGELGELYGLIYISMSSAYGTMTNLQTPFKDVITYSIKPLGYEKRNTLVENYVKQKYYNALTEEECFEKTKVMYFKLCSILGNKYIPPYPVFVLTILQSLDYSPLSTNGTSYGYCYQTLIHLALNQAGVPNDHIDSYINFMAELAFALYMDIEISESITERKLRKFHGSYSQRFWTPDFETLKIKLLASKILREEFGAFQFGYIYVYYFLVAKKIADMNGSKEGKKIVMHLFNELYIEQNANILVFITHHTKNIEFIEESIITSMLAFEEVTPITLKKSCNYYNLLNEIAKDVKHEIIEHRDPSNERTKGFQERDSIDRQKNARDEEEETSNPYLQPFMEALRSIEIAGQIVKNRKGSVPTETLKEMIRELYFAGFRMIAFVGDSIQLGKEELALRIEEEVTLRDSEDAIEKKVYRFLQFISLHVCLGIFSKLIHHVGVKELRYLYNEVAEEIDTPAAHIVTFSINTFYGKLNIKELEILADKYKGNIVVLQILRSRVKSYVYNNHVGFRLKQRIGACLNMKVLPHQGRKSRTVKAQ